MDKKYQIKHEIKKFNEVFGDDVKPSTVRQYQNDKCEIVEHEDTVNELLVTKALINGELYQTVIAFGDFGISGNSTSLDNMSAREFIEEYLQPNDAMISNAIERALNPKEISPEIKKQVKEELKEIKKKVNKK